MRTTRAALRGAEQRAGGSHLEGRGGGESGGRSGEGLTTAAGVLCGKESCQSDLERRLNGAARSPSGEGWREGGARLVAKTRRRGLRARSKRAQHAPRSSTRAQHGSSATRDRVNRAAGRARKEKLSTATSQRPSVRSGAIDHPGVSAGCRVPPPLSAPPPLTCGSHDPSLRPVASGRFSWLSASFPLPPALRWSRQRVNRPTRLRRVLGARVSPLW